MLVIRDSQFPSTPPASPSYHHFRRPFIWLCEWQCMLHTTVSTPIFLLHHAGWWWLLQWLVTHSVCPLQRSNTNWVMQVMACCQPCSSSTVLASDPLERSEEGERKYWYPASRLETSCTAWCQRLSNKEPHVAANWNIVTQDCPLGKRLPLPVCGAAKTLARFLSTYLMVI